MAVRVGSARIDERGKISGGAAGDNNGKEVATQNWYPHSKGWYVIRAVDANIRELIAKGMEIACANDNIGYDQNQRLGIVKNGVNSKVKTEADCSSIVRACCIYAGFDPGNFTTANEVTVLNKTKRFEIIKDAKICGSSANLRRGDILVTKTKGHTVVVLDDGLAIAKPTETAASKPEATNLPTVTYFKKYTGSSKSITTALASVGADSSMAYRKKIAAKNNIAKYSGTASQNITMLNLLKQGKLIKP